MATRKKSRIAVLPGDAIAHEIMPVWSIDGFTPLIVSICLLTVNQAVNDVGISSPLKSRAMSGGRIRRHLFFLMFSAI